MNRSTPGLCGFAVFLLFCSLHISAQYSGVVWKHLSSKNGDLDPPNDGTEQTSCVVYDVDRDGINDFIVTERTAAPAVVWYQRNQAGWKKFVVENQPLHIEAGSTFLDIDGDRDIDFVAGGDWTLNEVWWWENPCPNFEPGVGWKRHLIKKSDKPKHHDQIFGDFDGDGKKELVFWNQDSQKLYFARIPPNPRQVEPWPLQVIYSYSGDGQMEQRAEGPGFKKINEHEGLAVGDVDGDGRDDLVGGGQWFKYVGNNQFENSYVDMGYTFSRAAVGQLKKGGRPEILLVVGDGKGPLIWYEWVKGTWVSHKGIEVDNGHSLDLVDFNQDGNLDIFVAEMRLGGGNPQAKSYILLGDGNGNFKTTVVSQGIEHHESKIADLDGNGTLDILGKIYHQDAPRLDIWLNLGPQK
jgi:hypothetical protein